MVGNFLFKTLTSLLTDCTVRGGDAMKMGFGTFLNKLPIAVENALAWKDIMMVSLAVCIIVLLISFIVLGGVCVIV